MALFIALFNGNMGDPTEFEGITAVVYDDADGRMILSPTQEQKESAKANTFRETEIFAMLSLIPFMYVVTNRRRAYGASAILNRKAIKERLGEGNYIALPSSIHEWILLKDDDETDLEYCSQMVRQINGTDVVQNNEILGDRAYRIKI